MKSTLQKIIFAGTLSSLFLLSGQSIAKSAADIVPSDHMLERITGKISNQSMTKLAKKLNFSANQQEQMQAIKASGKAEMLALKPAMKAYREQVKALMAAEYFDEQAFMTLQSSNQAVFSEKALIKAKTKFKMKNLLTAEQLEQLSELKSKRRGKHKNKRQS
jgi:protein CpxP